MGHNLRVVGVERIAAVQRAKASALFIGARTGVTILATVFGFIFLLPLMRARLRSQPIKLKA